MLAASSYNFQRSIRAIRCTNVVLGGRNYRRKFSKVDGGSSPIKGPVSFAGLALMVATGGTLLAYYNYKKDEKTKAVAKQVKSFGKPALGGPWVLVDYNGIPRTDASYHGKFTLLYFGFTYCPDICPSELVKVGNIMKSLEGKTANLLPLFISVDPNRDTIGQLKHYAQDFHKDIVYLTGTRDQVAAAAKAYRVYFSKADENDEDDDDYLVDHSIVLYLIAPNGEFLDFFTQRSEVKDVSARILQHIADYNVESEAATKKIQETKTVTK